MVRKSGSLIFKQYEYVGLFHAVTSLQPFWYSFLHFLHFLRTVTMSGSDPNYDRSFLGNELSKSFEDLFTMT